MSHNLEIIQCREALPLYLKSLAMREKAVGSESPILAGHLVCIGILYRKLGMFPESEAALDRAFRDYQRSSSGNAMGLLSPAESLAIREKSLGPRHSAVATTLRNLGILYQREKKYADAEECFRRSLTIRETALGPDHAEVAVILTTYANFLRALNRTEEAVTMEARARAIEAKARAKRIQ